MNTLHGAACVLLFGFAVSLSACSSSGTTIDEQSSTTLASVNETSNVQIDNVQTDNVQTINVQTDNTQSTAPVNGDPAQASHALISGGSCSERVLPAQVNDASVNQTATNQVAPDQPKVNKSSADDFFECGEILPDTTINGPGLVSTGNGLISLGQSPVTVTTAAVEVFPASAFEHHSGIRLYLHDGEFRIAEQRLSLQNDKNETIVRHRVAWGIYNGSTILSIELASATQNSFTGGMFEYADTRNPNAQENIGMNLLLQGLVFFDRNGSGALDAADEIAQIVAGHISISGVKPSWSIAIDVLLDNGESINGYYSGDYIEIPIANASSN